MSKTLLRTLVVMIAVTTATCFAGILPVVVQEGVPASPLPTIGYQLYTTGGPVTFHFLGGASFFIESLYVDAVGVPTGSQFLFVNNPTGFQPDEVINGLPAGTLLTLRLEAVDPSNNMSFAWFSGPGSLNADGKIHALITPWSADSTFNQNGLFVGFEDFYNLGDKDYNDIMIVVTGVTTNPIPEPATLGLTGAALIAIGALRRRFFGLR